MFKRLCAALERRNDIEAQRARLEAERLKVDLERLALDRANAERVRKMAEGAGGMEEVYVTVRELLAALQSGDREAVQAALGEPLGKAELSEGRERTVGGIRVGA